MTWIEQFPAGDEFQGVAENRFGEVFVVWGDVVPETDEDLENLSKHSNELFGAEKFYSTDEAYGWLEFLATHEEEYA